MKPVKLFITLLMLLSISGTANAWKVSPKGGTLGFGTLEVAKAGDYKIHYSLIPGKPGSELRQGVQLIVVDWDDIFTEHSYYKIKSEHFVASVVEDMEDNATLTANLDPGRYIIIYGQWFGISHDNPNDPYFNLDVKGPEGSYKVTSKWAGDVTIDNPSERPYIPGYWGAQGKISVVWDNKAKSSFDIVKAFPGVKIATGFGNKKYFGN